MTEIKINKFKKYESGATFEFRYEGTPTLVFDEEKVDKLIETFLNDEKTLKVMTRNISYIRTILKDSNEKLLVVKYDDGKNIETVKYDNKILFSYEYKKYNEFDSNYMNVKYTRGDELSVSFSDLITKRPARDPRITMIDNYINGDERTEKVKDDFSNILDHIMDLKNSRAIYLSDDSKLLIEIYKLFYKENPDFSKKDIHIKMQTMVSILAQFNICCGDYSFDIIEKMPESLKLYQEISDLFPLGEVTVVDNPIQLKESAKEYIEIIGETIRETIGNERNMNDALITISKAIYAGRYDITYHDVKELVEYPNVNLTLKQAESSIKLVEKINTKMFENKIK